MEHRILGATALALGFAMDAGGAAQAQSLVIRAPVAGYESREPGPAAPQIAVGLDLSSLVALNSRFDGTLTISDTDTADANLQVSLQSSYFDGSIPAVNIVDLGPGATTGDLGAGVQVARDDTGQITLIGRADATGTFSLTVTVSDDTAPTPLSATRTVTFEVIELVPTVLTGEAHSIAIDGGTILVGQPYHLENGSDFSGRVSVFTLENGLWSFEQHLLPDFLAANYFFGSSVAIDGNIALIGAPGQQAAVEGRAYVFTRNLGVWSQQGARLHASDPNPEDMFGSAVALDGNHALVAASRESPFDDGMYYGSVYAFAPNGPNWEEDQVITAPVRSEDAWFGDDLSLLGTTALIGAWQDTDENGLSYGSAYVFTFDGSSWAAETKIIPTSGEEWAAFGQEVALDGDTLLIAWTMEDACDTDSGSVRVYGWSGSSATPVQTLLPSDCAQSLHFGTDIALDGDRAAISTDTGDVYLFVDSGDGWRERAKFVGFGNQVDLDGDALVVADDGGTMARVIDLGPLFSAP